MSDTHLILHVKGTESQTTELPKNVVRAAIAQGQISRSQLIWSQVHNAWKQVRELPHLLPSQKIAPAPPPRVGTTALPKPVAVGRVSTGPVPRIVAKASAGDASGTVNPVIVRPTVKVARSNDLVVEEKSGFPFMMWVCIILTVLILVTVGLNYFLVDRPLVLGMSQTTYANVPVYAHLGAFVQPDALVIHIPKSSAVTSSNLVDFLQALAHGTPAALTGKAPFDVVSLTTGWTGNYSIDGAVWKDFGDMTDADDSEKQAFLLDHLRDASGQALVSGQAEPDAVWADFVDYFTK